MRVATIQFLFKKDYKCCKDFVEGGGGTILGLVQLPKYFYVFSFVRCVNTPKVIKETKSSCVYNSKKTLILKIYIKFTLKNNSLLYKHCTVYSNVFNKYST